MKIVLTVDIPLDLVSVSFGRKGIEAMAFGYAGSFLVGELLVLFVMAMVGIDEIAEFPDFIFEMDGADFGIVEVRSCCCEGVVLARVLCCGVEKGCSVNLKRQRGDVAA